MQRTPRDARKDPTRPRDQSKIKRRNWGTTTTRTTTVATMNITTNIRNTNRTTESSANTQNVPWSVLGSPLRACWIVRFQFDVWNFAAIKARALGSVNHISLSSTSSNNPKKQSKMFKFVSNWLIQLVQRGISFQRKTKVFVIIESFWVPELVH